MINIDYFDDAYSPSKVSACNCVQCRYVKRKRKNRGNVKRIKRMLNKQRRTKIGKRIMYYWA